ncbi:sigma-70 family RNA polymerase sigma factor [Pseudanabaena sp. PCC 6802]|uniref:sigma-70 family RNA polymerase sigma factor n=1 Tax=Pseudanabaena sp. PCC 6802 TaxID=118173 RepID=UPI00034DF51E|nr:sigma-70 family RNA polymerase sigma factor [Pseudanabaena sp. PCC 6802]
MNLVSKIVARGESSELSDRQLVDLCLQGNTQSFAKLYQRHQQRVRSTLYQLCGAEALDDLVQEVFLRAWKGLSKFRQTAQFSTWLYRIAWNVACDGRKSIARTRSRTVTTDDDQIQSIPDRSDASTSNPALAKLHYQDLVQRGLEQLSQEHRTVVVLHDLEELPQKDVAEILEIPVGTVKSRLFHARTALKQFLELQGVEI